MNLWEFLGQDRTKQAVFIDPETGSELPLSQTVNTELAEILSSVKRSLVFLYTDNSLDSVSLFFTFLSSKHCLVLLSSGLALELKHRLESIYQPEIVADSNESVSYRNNSIYAGTKISIWYNPENNPGPIHPELKILLSTSGTTGSPKLVKLTETNFIANTNSILAYLPVDRNDVCALNLPFHYSYGLSVLLTNSAKGGKIICTNESVMSPRFWEIFRKYECNSLAGVPYTYEMLNRIGFLDFEGIHYKYLTQAGGKLNVNTLKKIATQTYELGIPFYVMYGQTEATARMSYLNPPELINRLGSIGKPVSEGRFRIDTDTSELIYTGPNVFHGYAEKREDLSRMEDIHELHTQDLATVDSEGYYYITGRISRFIKLFGNRISLDEVESFLKEITGFEWGVTGKDDKRLIAFSTISPAVTEGQILQALQERFKIHPAYMKVEFFETFPLTSNGKTHYARVLELHGLQ